MLKLLQIASQDSETSLKRESLHLMMHDVAAP